MEIPLDPSDNVIIRSTQETLEFMQVCQVPEKYLVNDVKPGDLIKIAFPDHISYLCKVFRNESNDCIVVSDVAIRRQDTGGHREGARFEKITCVPTEISKLTLDVFLYEDRIPIDLFEDQNVLVEVIRNLCMMVVLCDDFTIDLSAYQLLANNWGIARLENLHSDAGLGFVTSRTEITLNSIRFVNHALQSSITNPLSGLSLLRSSIESELRNKKGNSNLLLVGPSGCGKTSLIHSIADSLQANLFNFSPQISQLPGQNLLISRFERIIRLSRISSQQTLILIEDVEQFCPKKSRERRTTNPSSWELTHGLDMVREIEKITVIATTRNVEGVDSSLRRAGRLDREIFFKVPDEEQRREIVTGLFHEHLKEERETDSIIDLITSRTPAFVGGDLVELAKAATRLSRADYNNGIKRPSIERALLTVRPVGALSNPFLVERDPKMTLNSLGGLETLKKNLEMSIFRPLAHADAFLRFGLTLPKGILMYGPPGCAKTTVAKCLATEMNRHLIAVSAAQIYSPYVGDSEQLLAQIFHQARICAPSIIFIDEIDSIVGSRATDQKQRNDVQTKLLSTLLIEMDGVGLAQSSYHNPQNHILIIGATNRPDMLDAALMRPGRFDRLIYVPAPNVEERYDILNKITRKMPVDKSKVDLKVIAERTMNYSGADLVNLCNETALNALVLDQHATHLTMEHFISTVEKLKPSLTSTQIQWYEDFNEQNGL